MGTRDDETRTLPKSMRHKQILDAAAADPDASIAEIAAEVPSATPELVERVLDEHGDPAEPDDSSDGDPTGADDSTDGDTPTMDTNDHSGESHSSSGAPEFPSLEELTDAQRETLRAIARRPDAPQRELAELLDVTAATVSTRVNGLDGFEWDDREAFVREVLDTEQTMSESRDTDDTQTDGSGRNTDGIELEARIEELTDRVAALERQLDELTAETGGETDSPLAETELVHKIVHACMHDESISEEEERRILEALLE